MILVDIMMCTGIIITRHVPCSWRMNIAGSKLDTHTVVTMETSSVFLSQRDFQKDCFLQDGLAKYDVSAG